MIKQNQPLFVNRILPVELLKSRPTLSLGYCYHFAEVITLSGGFCTCLFLTNTNEQIQLIFQIGEIIECEALCCIFEELTLV